MNAKPFALQYAEAAREILEKEFHKKVTAEGIALRLGIGEKTLRRAFKKHYGFTIYAYQKRLRLEHAKQLLINGDKPVKHVSNLVGYRDNSSFCRIFRQYYGSPPSAWLGRDLDA